MQRLGSGESATRNCKGWRDTGEVRALEHESEIASLDVTHILTPTEFSLPSSSYLWTLGIIAQVNPQSLRQGPPIHLLWIPW